MGRRELTDRTAVRGKYAGGRVLSTKLSKAEGFRFDGLLAAVRGEELSAGRDGAKVTPAELVRRLILEAAERKGVGS